MKKKSNEEKIIDISQKEKENEHKESKFSMENFVENLLLNYTFKTMLDDESIFVYNEKGYYENGERTLKTICANIKEINSPGRFNQLKMIVEGKTYTNRSEFVVPENLINLSNGVLDIEKMELIDRSSNFNFQEQIPIEYNKDAKCPLFEKFINDVIPKGDKKLIQKWFGYHFVHDNRFKVFMLFLGVKNSGKSLMISILEKMIGNSNCTHFELRDFDDVATHAIPSLYGKIANTYADMSMKFMKDAGKIKIITGNDRISTRFHHKEPFNFLPYAKITVSTNKCPQVGQAIVYDDAYWNRCLILQFNTPNYGVIDENLKNKIINNEMSGILNWALKGYKFVISEGFKEYPGMRAKKIWSDSMMKPISLEKKSPEPIQTKCSKCGKPMENFHPEISEIVICLSCEGKIIRDI